MDVKINASIHNRFDIEVRDSVTGELKHSAVAYNLVTETGLDALAQGSILSNHNIHFGTGTGTLSPSRSTLFAWLGYRAATDVEIVYAYPTSRRKRSCVLQPADYVGSTITEVGLAGTSTNSSMNTHALLEDSEGNPISITKTDTDIITIYATVFATLSAGIPGVEFINTAANNRLMLNLLSLKAFNDPQPQWQLGNNPALIPQPNMLSGVASFPFGVKNTTQSSDTANNRLNLTTVRFETTQGNGNIREIAVTNAFRVVLPTAGVFEGQPYDDVPLGIGDGVNKVFKIPSVDIKDGWTVAANGVPTTDFEVSNDVSFGVMRTMTANSHKNWCRINTAGDKILLSTSSMSNLFVAELNGEELKTAWVALYRNGDGFITDDHMYMVMNQYNYITVFERTSFGVYAQRWTKWWDRSGSNPYAIAQDGSFIVFKEYSSNLMKWVWNGSGYVHDGTLVFPSVSFNQAYLSVACDVVMYVFNSTPWKARVYDLVANAWVERAQPTLISTDSIGALSGDGTTIAMLDKVDPKLNVAKWDGTSWTYYTLDTSYASINYNYVIRLSDNGNVLTVGELNTAMFEYYDFIDGAYVKRSTSQITSSYWVGALGFAVPSGDGKKLAFCDFADYPVHLIDAEADKKKITFNTAPAAGVAITADYTTKGIHKTNQYVVDVSASIQFGEGV